ncbi:MAG: thymidylate synthase, partial [Candidatus Adlerbacteria bacterium]|nr:thymidylate synthase [Candidatus Adlerbacteria bacterium]MDZ4226190.1 thymidylate synthase [Patescibacteria group bacterium]
FNIASYALLTIVLARILGREPGEFVHTFGDLHIYENHKEAAREQLTREPKAFPRIGFTQNFSSLEGFKPEFAVLQEYDPHSTIKAQLTIAGGYNKTLHG